MKSPALSSSEELSSSSSAAKGLRLLRCSDWPLSPLKELPASAFCLLWRARRAASWRRAREGGMARGGGGGGGADGGSRSEEVAVVVEGLDI